MRTLIALSVALLLAATPVKAECPRLTDAQVKRKVAELQLAPNTNPGIAMAELHGYCTRAPAALLCAGGAGGKLTLQQVRAVDWKLRQQFEYETDFVHYGVDDRWASGVVCGDCEDYVLTLADRLHAAGEGGAQMRLMIWRPEPAYGHATLLVETADAGVVEVGVGDADTQTPHPYDPSQGRRYATVRMDGQHKIEPFAGYRVTWTGDVTPIAGR